MLGELCFPRPPIFPSTDYVIFTNNNFLISHLYYVQKSSTIQDGTKSMSELHLDLLLARLMPAVALAEVLTDRYHGCYSIPPRGIVADLVR